MIYVASLSESSKFRFYLILVQGSRFVDQGEARTY